MKPGESHKSSLQPIVHAQIGRASISDIPQTLMKKDGVAHRWQAEMEAISLPTRSPEVMNERTTAFLQLV